MVGALCLRRNRPFVRIGGEVRHVRRGARHGDPTAARTACLQRHQPLAVPRVLATRLAIRRAGEA